VLDGEPRLYFKASCSATLVTAWMELVSLGQLLIDATEAKVEVSIGARGIGVKLKGKSKPHTHKQTKTEETFTEFKRTIYGVERFAGDVDGMQYAEEGEAKGTWTAASSGFMQRERASLLKFHATRGLAAAVMGNPDYHASPCIIICPFGSCSKAHRHLNSFSAALQRLQPLAEEAQQQQGGERA